MIIVFLEGEQYTVANVTLGARLATFETREEAEEFRKRVIG